MPVDFDLSGKVTLVTGGSRGVGRGIAEAFLAAGSEVVICARNAPATLPTAPLPGGGAAAGSGAASAAGPASGAGLGPAGSDAGADLGGTSGPGAGGAPSGATAGPGPAAGTAAGPVPLEPPSRPLAPSGERTAAFVAADVRDWDEIGRAVAATVDRFGRLDVVVNNAGGAPPASAATASPRFSRAIVELNLLAPLLVTQRANEVMQDQDGGGCVVNIASLTGMRPSPGTAAYGAAKAGLINLTESLAVEFAPKVRVNCVTAGALATEELHQQYGGDVYFEKVAATVPLGRIGTPADVAQVCLFLASESASFVTGANFVVHGGGDDPPPAEPDPT